MCAFVPIEIDNIICVLCGCHGDDLLFTICGFHRDWWLHWVNLWKSLKLMFETNVLLSCKLMSVWGNHVCKWLPWRCVVAMLDVW